MRRRILIKISLFSLFIVLGFLLAPQAKASAATWCGVLAYAPTGNCTDGQDYTALTGLSGSSDQLKSQFINKMHGFEQGQHFQRVGAQYIEDRMFGGSGWEDVVNSPDVTFSIGNHSYTQNTAYDPSTDRDITYADNDTRQSLIITYKGVIYNAIKLDCGNPVGGLNLIPKGWILSGTTNISDTSGKPGQTVTFTHNVHNQGPAAANYTWTVQSSTGGNYGRNGLPTGSPNSVGPGGNAPDSLRVNYRIPNDARKGDVYCQRIQYTNATGPSTGTQNSAPKCVTVGGSGGGSSGQCRSVTVTDDGGYNVPGGNSNPRPTQTHVIVHGTTVEGGAPSPGYGTDPGIDTVSNRNPIGNGESRTWDNLTPISSVIYVQRIRQYKSTNGVWNNYVDTTEAIPCYSAACSVSIDGQVPGDPNGVIANQPFTVHATVINNFYTPTYRSDLPSNIEGSQLSLNNGDIYGNGSYWGFWNPFSDIDEGQSETHDFTLTAPNDTGQHPLVAHPAYSGLFAFGDGRTVAYGQCSVNVNIYKHFTLTPIASTQLSPSNENPSAVNYPIGVIQQNDQYDGGIPASLAGTLYKQVNGGPAAPVSNANYSGTYITTIYNNPPPSWPIAGAIQAGDQYCSQATVNPATGYLGPYGIIDGQPATSPLSCDHVTNKPYFKAYNGGVSAGGGFKKADGSCSSGPGGGILAGWNDNTGGADRGASSQLSALAMIKITGFASAQTSITRSPTDLTFANTIPSDISSGIDSPGLGGNFSPGGSRCLSDVLPPTGATTLSGASTPANRSSGAYVHNGNLTITGGSLGPDNNVSYFVNGDAYISGNITYNNWPIGHAPSFVLKASGNIYIDPSVTELDGLYIAKNKIYTCGVNNGGSFAPVAVSSLHGTCNNQLVIYGNFIAKQLNLLRTFGSLRDEKPIPGTPGVPPTPPVIGAKAPLLYSSSGPIANARGCVNLKARSEFHQAWQDNYLCPNGNDASLVKLGWTNQGNTAGLRNQGLNNCTAPWGSVLGSYDRTGAWSQSYLCSNLPISFSRSPQPGRLCTFVTEPASRGWPSTFVCIIAAAPASPGTPARPPQPPVRLFCSNKGRQTVGTTCAAEVFEFNPALYISSPSIQLPSNGAVQYDSITSLPPVL